MGERRGRPVAAFIGLVTLVLAGGGLLTVLVMVIASDFSQGGRPHALLFAALGVLGAGGLWAAWRAFSGRWRLRSRAAVEAPDPGAAVKGEGSAVIPTGRPGRPWAVVGRVVLTVVVATLAGFIPLFGDRSGGVQLRLRLRLRNSYL